MFTRVRYKIALFFRKKGNLEARKDGCKSLGKAIRFYDLANMFLPSAKAMRKIGVNFGEDLLALEAEES